MNSIGQLAARVALGLMLFAGGGGVARATSVIAPDFDELVNESDYVVRAVVKSVASEYRDGPNGRSIVSRIELDVREVITGSPPEPLVLQMLGGQIGEEELRIEGAPRFEVGDEDILFVSGNGRTIYPLYAIMHGRYPILKDAKTGAAYVARSNRVPLQDTAEVAHPVSDGGPAELLRRLKGTEEAMSPEQFIRKIRAAVNPNYRRARQN